MSPGGDERIAGRPVDAFISYSPADEHWASWIAWQLELAGHRTLVHAWDSARDTGLLEFTEQAVRAASITVAVLSRAYLGSPGLAPERAAALRTDVGRLVTVLVDGDLPDGVPGGAARVDLARVSDARTAGGLLLGGLRPVLAAARRPAVLEAAGNGSGLPAPRAPLDGRSRGAAAGRRIPGSAPPYPPTARAGRDPGAGVSVLHVPGPRFGRGLVDDPDEPTGPEELRDRIQANVTRLVDTGVPRPDLVVVTGDLTESAGPRQMDDAWTFLTGLRVGLGLGPQRLVVVPGLRDVSEPACKAYFYDCEAREDTPLEPYFPKLRHYAELFDDLYHGLELLFDSAQPWTLFTIPELRVACAGLNSTWAITHRPEDQYGAIGDRQAVWFNEKLREFEQRGWLRLGVVRHDPVPGPGVGADEPETLRDAGTLAGVLGNRINLLLHGPGWGEPKVESLPGTPVRVVPRAHPGHEEILHITAGGLRRYSTHDHDLVDREDPDHPFEFDRVEVGWRSTTATFTSPSARAGSGNSPGPPALEAVDRHGALLRRVAEVCTKRWADASIYPLHAEPPQMLVTWQDGALTGQTRIGAYAGALTTEVVEEFLRGDHVRGGELIYEGQPPDVRLHQLAKTRGARLRSYPDFQSVLDLSDYRAQQTARLHEDRVYRPNWYVPQRYRELGRGGEPAPDLVEDLARLLGADEGCFVLLLGDFGRGKSFALRELARRLGESDHTSTPILINLAALDRSMAVESLVAAHLSEHGQRFDPKAFRYLLDEGRIVLLFDGFDELVIRTSYDRAADHLEKLLDAARGKAKIVVASRSQHFRSHEQAFRALGRRAGQLANRRILTVEEFTADQIHRYLVKRHGDQASADRRYDLLRGAGDLLGLAHNPRMLSFIAELDDQRISAAAGNRDTVSPARLYEQILDAWMVHEYRRVAAGPDGPSMDTGTLWTAVTALAVRLWETGAPFLDPGDVAEVATTLTGLVPGHLSRAEREHAVGSGSLLVRTDDGQFGFIHRSVMEWLLAKAIAAELADPAVGSGPGLLHRRPLTQLTVDFLCDVADAEACRRWAARAGAGSAAGDAGPENATRILNRLNTPAHADLRGRDLRGQDLSRRDFTDADLTGTDLSGAVLVGTNLTGATLRDAVLVGARLDEARLVGADLSGADLRRARLTRADLAGATVSGSTRWARAALINAEGARQIAPAGAAVAPGSPVVAELAPSSIGIGHSFDPELEGLPEVVAYSPDGDTLAVGSDEGGVLICDSLTGRPVRTLQGHRGRVCAVAYGGDLLVTAAHDGSLRVWDAHTGRGRWDLTGLPTRPWPVVVDPRGGFVAAADGAGVLRIWDLADGRRRPELGSDAGPVVSMALHGTRLAVAHQGGGVRIVDVTGPPDTGRRLETGPVRRLAFSPDGRLLVTGGAHGELRVWDASTGRPTGELAGHGGAIHALAVHPTEATLVTGDSEGTVRLWRLDPSGSPAGAVVLDADAPDAAAVYAAAFSPSGDLVAVGDRAGRLRLWDPRTAEPRDPLTGHTGSIWPFAFHPAGTQLAVSDDQRTTRLWDPATGRCEHTLTGHGRRVTSVRFSADGTLLATTGNDGRVRLWDTARVRLREALPHSGDPLVRLRDATFSPAGPLLAMVGADGRIGVLNTDTGRYERHLQAPAAPIWAIAVSAGGDRLATANDDDTVGVWYHPTGHLMHTLVPHRGRVRSIAFSPDGALIATGCDDSEVRLWDATSGELLRTLSGHDDRVYAVSFGRDRLASASWDGRAIVWDLASGVGQPIPQRHTGRLWATAFHPSGELLATAGDDLGVRLWTRDGDGYTHLQTLPGHTRGVISLAFSPTGDLLASGGEDGTSRLWAVEGDEVVRRGTLLGLPDGWAALGPDNRYKTDGTVRGEFWHVIGTCRFEIGELDDLLSEVRHVPASGPM